MKTLTTLIVFILFFSVSYEVNKRRRDYNREMESIVFKAFSLNECSAEVLRRMKDGSYIGIARACMKSIKTETRALEEHTPLQVGVISALARELARNSLKEKGIEITDQRDFMIDLFIGSYLYSLDCSTYSVNRRSSDRKSKEVN